MFATLPQSVFIAVPTVLVPARNTIPSRPATVFVVLDMILFSKFTSNLAAALLPLIAIASKGMSVLLEAILGLFLISMIACPLPSCKVLILANVVAVGELCNIDPLLFTRPFMSEVINVEANTATSP